MTVAMWVYYNIGWSETALVMVTLWEGHLAPWTLECVTTVVLNSVRNNESMFFSLAEYCMCMTHNSIFWQKLTTTKQLSKLHIGWIEGIWYC